MLTGKFADGLGNVKNVPDRIDFDPFPWQSMAVWMLTQMKRWGYVKGDVDYKADRRAGVPAHRRAQAHEASWAMKAPDGDYREVQGHGQGVRPGASPTTTSAASPSGGRAEPDRDEPAALHLKARRLLSLLLLRAVLLSAPGHRRQRLAGRRRRRGDDGRADEYAKLMGKDAGGSEVAPAASRRRRRWARPSSTHLRDPFYDNGPNDKGIGIQLALLARARRGRLLPRRAGRASRSAS